MAPRAAIDSQESRAANRAMAGFEYEAAATPRPTLRLPAAGIIR
jgi:hypothetical protein